MIRNNPDADKNDNWLFKISKNKYILPLCLYDKNAKVITNTINTYFNIELKNGNYIFTDYKKDYQNRNKLNELKEYRNILVVKVLIIIIQMNFHHQHSKT